jgi:aminomethyltransferase
VSERTILHPLQLAAGAKMIDFHGWEMPVQFSAIAAEHRAVRTAAGMFDLCHMGRLTVSGAGATDFLARRVCRPLADMEPGVVRYGLVLAEDGTVEDDVLVSREGPEAWHVVVNASNREKILGLWRPALGTVTLGDHTGSQAMIAVQGPQARILLERLGLASDGLKYYRFRDLEWRGTSVRLSRTGYTGEDGCECFLPSTRAPELWQALAGAGVAPCGLGARDTLRLEAGMPLYGQELDRSTTPVEAGLAFACGTAGGYVGDRVVLGQLAHGAPRRLVGLRVRDRRVPRAHYPLRSGGTVVGAVTSGTLSPSLDAAIGMGYVPAALAEPGTVIEVDVRGEAHAAEVVPLPFYRRPR